MLDKHSEELDNRLVTFRGMLQPNTSAVLSLSSSSSTTEGFCFRCGRLQSILMALICFDQTYVNLFFQRLSRHAAFKKLFQTVTMLDCGSIKKVEWL